MIAGLEMPNKRPYLELRSIEDRGAGLVAVFFNPYEEREICLNRANLTTRIKDLAAAGHDTSVEEHALSLIDQRQLV